MKTGLLKLAPSVNTPERATGEALLHGSPLRPDSCSLWTPAHDLDASDTPERSTNRRSLDRILPLRPGAVTSDRPHALREAAVGVPSLAA